MATQEKPLHRLTADENCRASTVSLQHQPVAAFIFLYKRLFTAAHANHTNKVFRRRNVDQCGG
jgi:hypothetical protein